MIYLFITATIQPVQELWGPVQYEGRKGRYDRCISVALHSLNELNIKPVILINDNDVYESYLDKFKQEPYNVDILYTSNNPTNTTHKGKCEFDSIEYAMKYYQVKDDDIIIKQTGRYCLCEPHENYFYSTVVQNYNNFDCFMKFMNIATNEYNPYDCVLGLYAMKGKYLKKFQYKLSSYMFNNSNLSAEVEFATYVRDYIPNDRIYEIPELFIEYSPANNPDICCYT